MGEIAIRVESVVCDVVDGGVAEQGSGHSKGGSHGHAWDGIGDAVDELC